MILKAKNIKKSYHNGQKELKVLKGLDLEIQYHEIVTVMGPSGSGKSTLLNILGTLDTPDSGELFIHDLPISGLKGDNLSRLRNNHLGFVFQFHHLLPEFTAFENVMIPAILAKKENKLESRALELFNYLGLYDRRDHYPTQLSGGERSRVAVMRALINAPDLVLADEPTGNLDVKNAQRMIELFQNICKDFNQAMIITTHNIHVAQIGKTQWEIMNGTLIPLNSI
jgi:lipoprotein-releasing system ATP-binding protein